MVQIKRSGWLAAGDEVRRALEMLSDGAFRVYFHLCMSADRNRGIISVNYGDLATTLQRSRRSISTYMDELRRLGICTIRAAANQHAKSEIEICDEFWPYTKASGPSGDVQGNQYVNRIQSLLAERACVRCSFTGADRRLGTDLAERRVNLEQVERGIELGCTRKYVSLLNGSERQLILSFAYFREPIEEAGDEGTPAGYWDYIHSLLKRLEARWEQTQAANAKSASA